jgi:hypothetical protein
MRQKRKSIAVQLIAPTTGGLNGDKLWCLVDPLADVFDLSRVSCGVMAQLIAYEPWGVTIDPVPGAAFHAVVAGSCWLRIPGRAPQHLMPGDVVLLPTNTPHELVSSSTPEQIRWCDSRPTYRARPRATWSSRVPAPRRACSARRTTTTMRSPTR